MNNWYIWPLLFLFKVESVVTLNQISLQGVNIKFGLQNTDNPKGGPAKEKGFVHFHICCSPIFLLSIMGSYVSQLLKLFVLQALPSRRYYKIQGKSHFAEKRPIFSINWCIWSQMSINFYSVASTLSDLCWYLELLET